MTDKDHRNTAAFVLATAHKVVTTERGNQHGGAEDSFQMIGDLWSTYLRNQIAKSGADVSHVNVTAYDVAQMMTLLKIARAVHGNPTNEDNYVDASGYQSLAAAIAGVTVPVKVAEVVTRPDGGQEAAPRIVHKHVLMNNPTPPAESTADKGKPLDLEGAALSALVSKLETPNA